METGHDVLLAVAGSSNISRVFACVDSGAWGGVLDGALDGAPDAACVVPP